MKALECAPALLKGILLDFGFRISDFEYRISDFGFGKAWSKGHGAWSLNTRGQKSEVGDQL